MFGLKVNEKYNDAIDQLCKKGTIVGKTNITFKV